MTQTAELLIEIGTEELPPKALLRISQAFADGVQQRMNKLEIAHGDVKAFATPRRLALHITDVAAAQPTRNIEKRGPALAAAYGADGQPSKAALGFARSCGVEFSALGTVKTDKGEWLAHNATETGKPLAQLLPDVVADALNQLPIPKRMRWGDSDIEFVRPVHWLVMLYGGDVVPGTILGRESGKLTFGHRFLAPQAIELASPTQYAARLRTEGHVIADFAERREIIESGVTACATTVGATAVIDPDLLDEVTALTEWPVPLSGEFDEEFLKLPTEVLIATMQEHQRYFPLINSEGELLARFITVANIDSPEPQRIVEGNQRVIRPRLTDAAFFFTQDQKIALVDRLGSLANMVFEKQLGTLRDKTDRVIALAVRLAIQFDSEPELVERAALLSRCDLTTGMVGEFPELQGTMGGYYATASGEPAPVARAISEFYQPRFAGDELPQTTVGQCVSLADRIDTIVGIFGIGKEPTGDKDPFALRRHAVAILRIAVEKQLSLNLSALIDESITAYGERIDGVKAREALAFTIERLRGYCLDHGADHDSFESVKALDICDPLDFDRRVRAVTAFRGQADAAALAAANKRAANILRKNEAQSLPPVRENLLMEPAERDLFQALTDLSERLQPVLAAADYPAVLAQLAQIRPQVDKFFDTVLVMDENPDIQRNRLALLTALRHVLCQVADISRLPG
ncbi:MAG: glycine--tRNA ligase subunit beta [Gammaproteobacteria bacterium]|nr:glycine--tRNA ligase subunit beta [Gammaproteobacteria bacterium]